MSGKIYPAGRFVLETDVQRLEDGSYQGIVSIREESGGNPKESLYRCEKARASAEQAQADADRYAATRQQQQALEE